jgi:AraC-like DNA-binding protein
MNTKEQAKELIKLYCEHFSIKPSNLKRTTIYARKIFKKKNLVINTATIRMSLGYFLFMHFPLTIKEIAYMIGYTDHSPISSQRKQISHYINNQDNFFMSYYSVLLSLAKEIGINTEYRRVHSQTIPFVRYESDTQFLENIKYYENA